jgi:hypothetical protein
MPYFKPIFSAFTVLSAVLKSSKMKRYLSSAASWSEPVLIIFIPSVKQVYFSFYLMDPGYFKISLHLSIRDNRIHFNKAGGEELLL